VTEAGVGWHPWEVSEIFTVVVWAAAAAALAEPELELELEQPASTAASAAAAATATNGRLPRLGLVLLDMGAPF
jgi:hypothetical protein